MGLYIGDLILDPPRGLGRESCNQTWWLFRLKQTIFNRSSGLGTERGYSVQHHEVCLDLGLTYWFLQGS